MKILSVESLGVSVDPAVGIVLSEKRVKAATTCLEESGVDE